MEKPKSSTSIIASSKKIQQTIDTISNVLLGKNETIKLALTCLISKGHLLIEDKPGVGKTTLAEALSRTLGLDYKRIQCTNDMMPSDIIGFSLLDQSNHKMLFKKGPVFTNLLLADEINRSTPRSQSALLEAMEEYQVTVEGTTRQLPSPFFVIATQNPLEQSGTFPLPESQLDRFQMRISIGYPDKQSEIDLLNNKGSRANINLVKQTLDADSIIAIQDNVDKISVSSSIVNYIVNILQKSRESDYFVEGLSPRSGIAIKKAAQAWALINGRDYVLPDDVKSIIASVCCHRLVAKNFSAVTPQTFNDELLKHIAID